MRILPDLGRGIRGEVRRVWRTLEDETLQGFALEERALILRAFLQVRENLVQVTGGDRRFK